MKPIPRKFLWPAVVVAATLGALWQFVPLRDAGTRMDSLPLSGLGFAGRDVPLTDIEADTYQTARTLKRIYQVGPQRAQLLVIDGSRNRHAVHDPTFCFRGAGWTVVNSRDLPVPGGQARLLTLSKAGVVTEAMCWFSDGVQRHSSAPRYWWETTLRRLSLGHSGAEPILLIVQASGGGTLAWDSLLHRFPALLEL